MFSTLCRWGSFVKFHHTVFALPFALAAMAVAARENRGWPGWRTFALILAAMVCARTCAMAFNRIVDRKLDALNPRTAGRHLPTGQVTLPGAISLCALSAAGLIGASFLLNSPCFMAYCDIQLPARADSICSEALLVTSPAPGQPPRPECDAMNISF